MSSLVCTYASKPCSEPRAVKENGELHRLCEFHRDKANEAQRRWHARHQVVKRVRPGRHHRRASEPLAHVATDTADVLPRRHQSMTQELTHFALHASPSGSAAPPSLYLASLAPPPGTALSADDLALLSEIFADADDEFSAKYDTAEGYEFVV